MAELELPAAGKTVANRRSEISSQTVTAGFSMAKGQTPPTAWPVNATTSSGESIFALVWKWALNLALSIRVSPAQTTNTQPYPTAKDNVLAMRAASHPAATAASSTVAEETENSRISPSLPRAAKKARTFSMDTPMPPSSPGLWQENAPPPPQSGGGSPYRWDRPRHKQSRQR